MSVLDELEREITRVAEAAGDLSPRRRWWRSAGVFGLLPLGIATAAVAAATSGVLTGAPVKNPQGLKPKPNTGYGVVVGSSKLLSLSVADPAGGPPWALRTVRTSRELGCVQLGRLVDGKLGVLGRAGAFGDDGRFHALGTDIEQQIDCGQTDGAGNLFIVRTYYGMPDSGVFGSCTTRVDDSYPRPVCPPGSMREIRYALLGPEATAVTYLDAAGAVIRERVSSPEGAYLIVTPAKPSRRDAYFAKGVSPGSGLRTIEYRDGSVCRISTTPRLRPAARACALKGMVEIKLSPVPAAELATSVRALVGTRPEHPTFGRPAVKGVPVQRRVTVRFRARRAADARSSYTISTELKAEGNGCRQRSMGPILRDVKAGTIVKRTLWLPFECHNGALDIKIGFAQMTRPGVMPFSTGGFGNDQVGTVRVGLPK